MQSTHGVAAFGEFEIAVVDEIIIVGDQIALTAAIYSPDGAEKVDGTVTLSPGDRDAPARLAADLLARASPAITALFTGPE